MSGDLTGLCLYISTYHVLFTDSTNDPLGADAQRFQHQHRESDVAEDHHHVRHLWLCILLLRHKVPGTTSSRIPGHHWTLASMVARFHLHWYLDFAFIFNA